MSEIELGQAYIAAYKQKMRLLLYYAVRRMASARMLFRKEKNLVRVWPPFQEGIEEEPLAKLRRDANYYLGYLNIPVLSYLRDSRGLRRCMLCGTSGQGADAEYINETVAKKELKRVRYCAVWRTTGKSYRSSIAPYIYVVSHEPGGFAVNEWLRLVSDIYRSRAALPKRRIPCPDYPIKSCALLGTGPSLVEFAGEADQWDAWIGANSVVCDERIRSLGKPFALCLLDPLYFSPLSSMRSFWLAAFALLRETSAVLITTLDYAAFIELRFPYDIKKKCYYVRTTGHDTPRIWAKHDLRNMIITPYANVLTDLMLPLAASISSSTTLYGCDGRSPSERTAYLPKAASLEEFDNVVWNQVEKAPDQERDYKHYLYRFSLFTRYMVNHCIRRGMKIYLRRPSWNAGLQKVPLLNIKSKV